MQLQSSAQPEKGLSFSFRACARAQLFLRCVLLISFIQFHFLSLAVAAPIRQGTIGTVSTPRNEHYTASPTIVNVSKDVAYAFFVTSGGSCGWAKTTNGGMSWGSINTDLRGSGATDCFRIAVWYDRWTPGDTTGNYIHIMTLYASSNDIAYTRFDTTNDTKATYSWGTGMDITATNNFVAVTKLTSGAVTVSMQGATQTNMQCSSNCHLGANWATFNAPQATGAGGPVQLIALPSGGIFFLWFNQGTGDLKYREGTYSSGNITWDGSAPTVLDASANVGGTSSNYKGNVTALYNPDDGYVYLAYRKGTSPDSIEVYRYSVSGNTMTARTQAMNGVGYGVHDIALGYDGDSKSLVLFYAARTSSGNASSAYLYMITSYDGANSWGGMLDPLATVYSNAADHSGLSTSNYIPSTTPNSQRLYLMWVNEDTGVAYSLSRTQAIAQRDYRFFTDTGTTAVTTALAAESTGVVDPPSTFRVRMVLENPQTSFLVPAGDESFKLQYEEGCNVLLGASWADVSTNTPIAFYNGAAADGAALTENGSLDPQYNSVGNHPLTYVESAPFSNSASADFWTFVWPVESLLFDFELTASALTAGNMACLRVVMSDGTPLDDYSYWPLIRKTGTILGVSGGETPNGSYKAGQTIGIAVTFSSNVFVTGSNPSPTLTLNTGATATYAGIDEVDGRIMYFTYTVQAGENTSDLDYSATNSLAKNNYTINDSTGNAFTLTLPTPGAANSLGANAAIVIDTTTPSAPSITSPTNGATTADTTPTISGTSEANASIIVYRGGSTQVCATTANGSGAWTCDASPALAEATYSLTAKATDAAGNVSAASSAVSLTIAADVTPPTVQSVSSSTANGTYKAGQAVAVTVTFSENVTVTGTPRITLNVGGGYAVDYTSGSGTNTLTFNYTIQAGQTSNDLDYVNTSSLALNGGTIRDAAANNATLTLATPGAANSLGANKAIVVDTTAPTVQSVSATTANGSYKAGQTIDITVQFTENVTVSASCDTYMLANLNVGVGVNVAYFSGSGGTQHTFRYTVQAGHNSADLDYTNTNDLQISACTIYDVAGNAVTRTLPAAGAAFSLGSNKNIVIDTTAPTVSSVSSSATNGSYKAGDVIAVTVGFTENVTVTGTPQLTLNVGGGYAVNYASGSGTNTLTFNYTVQSGHTSSDLDYVNTSSLGLNSGTISDAAANAATLTLASPGAANSLGANKALVIDTTAPSAPTVSSPADGAITSDTTPTFAGTSEASATIVVYRGGATQVCTTTADGSGNWTCDANPALSDATYSITAKATDAAGNTSSASTARSLTIDGVAPSAPVITSPPDGTDSSDNTPTFVGTSEANATIVVYRGGNTQVCTTTADGNGDWSCDASPALSDGSYSITAKATDAGNNTSSASTAHTLNVDATAPAAPSITSPSNNTNTNDTTPTFVGTSEANAAIVVYRGGNTQVCTTTADGSGDWSCDANPALAEGTYSITAKATDSFNNTSAASSAISITVDTTAPAAPSITSPTDGATTADTTPTFVGTSAANASIIVYRGGNTQVCTTTADGSGDWSCDANPALADATYSITAKATDAASNTSAASSAVSLTIQQSSGIEVTGVSATTANGTYKAGDAISITVTFNGNATVNTGGGTPTLALNAGGGASASYASGSGTATLTFTYTVGASQTASDLDYSATNSLALNGGTIKDGSAVDATLTLPSPGAAGSLGANKNIVIDTTAPAAPSITSPTDGTATSDTTPTFVGTAAANVDITVYRGGSTSVCTATADGNGDWTCTPGVALGQATYSITAKAADAVGNESAASAAVSITVDTTAPSAPSITSPADNASVNDTTPTFVGTSEANATIVVYRGGSTQVCTTTADGSGDWTCDANPALAEGTYSITAKATDAANNTSVASTARSLTVDTTAPAAPTMGTPDDGDTLSDSTPTFTGTAEANASMTVYRGGATVVCTTTADGSGIWTCDASPALADGTYSFTAKATDAAGNTSAASTASSVTLDTTPPTETPTIDSPADGTVTNDNTPTFAGTAPAGAKVELFINGADSGGSSIADGSGNWNFTTTSAPDGTYSITVKIMDSAGNVGPASNAVSITIDATAPAAPVITTPPNGTDSSDNTPTFVGTAEADSTVTVYRGGNTVVCTTTTDGNGDWTCDASPALADGTFSITAKATDEANNTSAASTAVTVNIDATAPAAPIITSPTTGASTNDTTPTFVGTSEADAAIIVYRGGNTQVCTTTADGNGDWTCDANPALLAGTYSITAKATDSFSNTSAASTAVSVTVDTTAPSAPTISSPADAAELGDTTPTISGTSEANASIVVYRGGNTQVCTTTADGSGNWSCDANPALAEGTYSLTAKATDAANNTSGASSAVSITIDTTAPAVPDITLPVDQTESSDNTPSFVGTADPNVTVTVYRGGNTQVCTTTSDGNGDWSCDASPALSDGTFSITAKAIDGSNNASAASTAISLTIDTTAPAAPAIVSPVDGARSNNTTFTFEGTSEGNASVTVYRGGSTVVCTGPANGAGNWNCDANPALAEGTYTLTAKATDGMGNTSVASAAVSFTIDTTPPGAPTITSPVTNTPTNDTTPTFSGTADANTTVTIYNHFASSEVLCSTTANGSGAWSCDSDLVIASGVMTVAAKSTDAAGNTGPASQTVAVPIDTTAPGAPVITSPTDGEETNDTTPTFTGTTSEGAATITVYRGGNTVVCTATENGMGGWSCTPNSALAEGTYSITAKQTDIAGNESVASAAISVIIDTTPPAGTPTITSPTDGVTISDANPDVSGTAPANAVVRLFVDGSYTGVSTTADGSGNWSLTASLLSPDGSFALTARVVDLAGNLGTASTAVNITLDTTAPDEPVIVSPTDNTVTNDNTPTYTGTAEANSTVKIYDASGPTLICTTTADGSGNWSCTVSTLSDGAHVTGAVATDTLGNEGKTDTLINITIDTSVPSAPTIATPADGARTNDTTPTFVGTSEANATVVVYRGGNTQVCTTTADGNGDWTCDAGSALSEGTYSITAKATDAASNTSAASTAQSLIVDTSAPSAPTISAPADNAKTNDSTPTFSGTGEANASVTVYRGGSTAVCTTTADGSGNWTCDANPALAEGSYSITAKQTDGANNTSAASTARTLTVDTTAPSAPAITTPPDGTDSSDSTPTFVGTAEANAAIIVYRGGNTQVCTTTADGNGDWSCDANPALSDGSFSITAKATDAANNTSAASTAATINIDATPPAAPTITAPTDNTKTSDTTPTFVGTSEANAAIVVYRGGNTQVCTTTADGNGGWACDANPALAEGAYSITAKATDDVNNTSAASAAVAVTVDTTAPSAPAITAPTDNAKINDTTPTFVGTSEANASIVVYRGGNTQVCTTTADVNGDWTCDANPALAEGSYTITAKATDGAGNTGSASTGRTLTVDTTAPSAPVITTPPDGTDSSDNTPTFVGTSEADATVIVYRGGNTQVCTTTADGNGDWTCDASPSLADGTFSITAKATDAANNTSTASTAVGITIDATAPAAPTISSPTDGTSTNDSTPSFTGTAEANSTVELFRGGSTSLGTTTADGSGAWALTLSGALTDGTYSITAKATDSFGNIGSASTAVGITVDTNDPSAPVITSPTDGTETADNTPAFSGTAEPDSTVEIFRAGSTSLGTATADGSGNWSFTPSSSLADGTHSITAKATDGVGNTGTASTAVSITVDTTAPAAPVITSPTDGAVTGDNTPTISGTAEANSTVEVFEGGSSSLGTATANGSGAWTLTVGSPLSDATYPLTAKATDSVSNTSAASTAVSLIVDTGAPSEPTITSPTDGTVTGDNTPTISGTAEANGTVEVFRGGSTSLGTTTANGSGNWSFTPSSSISDGTHSITAKVKDGANNTSAASSAVSITIDTAVPTAPAITSPTDGTQTNDNTPTISGTAEADSTVEIFRGGSTSLGTTTADGSGNWTLTVGSALSDATYSITAKSTDSGNNTSAASTAISLIVDTAPPAAPSITSPTDGTTTGDSTPTISGTAEADSTVEIFRGGSTSLGTAITDGSGNWTFTVNSALGDATYSLTAKATDGANNTSAASSAVSLIIDTATPNAPAITSPTNNTTTGDNTPTISGTAEANSTVEVFRGGSTSLGTTTTNGSGAWTLTIGSALSDATYSITAKATDAGNNTSVASTAVSITVDTDPPSAPSITTPTDGTITADSTPTISGTAEANSNVEVFRGGSTSLGTTTANGSGAWTLTVGSALSDGVYSITAKATDTGSNTSTASTAVSITVDTTPPAAPSISSPTDGANVNDATPAISGTAEANSTVEIFDGATSLGTAAVDGSGNWAFTPSTDLAAGSHSLTAKATDAAANTSVASSAVSIIVDTTPPVAPVITSPTDGTTTGDNTPTISGTAEADSTVEVFRAGSMSLGTTTTDGSGNWSLTVGTALSDGSHSLTAKATDAANNTGTASTAVSITVDTGAPNAPVITVPANNAITNDNTPTITGTAEANSDIEVFRGGATSVCTATANGSGAWTCTSGTLGDGAYSLTAKSTDAGNNVSAASTAVSITVDTTAPSAPTITAPTAASNTNDLTPTISGTAEANSTVQIFDGATSLGTVTADGSGNWTLTPSADLTEGSHTFRARATDAATNTGPDSVGVTITIDSAAPSAPSITVPSNNDVTSDNTPVISGTAEANTTISVYSGATLLGTVTAGGMGAWSFTPSSAMNDGDHSLTAKATDAANNTSAASAAVTLTIDTIAPVTPFITSPTDGLEINDSTPTITGTAEQNTTVYVLIDGTPAGSTVVNSSAAWSFTPTSSLTEGAHTVAVYSQDRVNTSPTTTAVNFTVSLKFVISGYIRLKNATHDPLPGVEVSDGTRTAVTDANGMYVLSDVPTGTYMLSASRDNFDFEAGADTNPAILSTEGLTDKDFSAKPKLANPVYVPWNGFIEMVNVMEIVNTDSSTLTATVTLYDLYGIQAGAPAEFTIRGGSQFDVILNNLEGFQKENYGLAKVEMSHDQFDGRLTYYRRAGNKIDFDFGFPIPFMNSVRGKSYVTYNTYQPSAQRADANHLVVQWLTVVNTDPDNTHEYTINRYDMDGKLIWSNEIVLGPMGRYDIEGGHEVPGLNNVGVNEVIPADETAPYIVHLIRYGSNGPADVYPDGYDFAVALIGQTGTGRAHYVPIANTAGSDNYVEVVNVTDQPISVIYTCHDSDGKLVDDSVINLPPRGQEHIYTSSLLSRGMSGLVTFVPSVADSLLAQSVTYYRRPETGQILSAASSQASEPFGTANFGSYNSFLGMNNWLRLVNVTDNYASVTVSLNPYGNTEQQTLILSPRSRVDYNLNQGNEMAIGSEGYGTLAVQSTEEGGVLSEVVRVRKKATGQIDFVASTIMR